MSSRPTTWSTVAPPRQYTQTQAGYLRDTTITNLTVVNLSCRDLSNMSHTHWSAISTNTSRISSLEFCVSRSGNDIYIGANGGMSVAQTIYLGQPGDTVVISGITTTIETQTLHVSDSRIVLNVGDFAGQLSGAGVYVGLSLNNPSVFTNGAGEWILQNMGPAGVSMNVTSVHTASIQHWNAILSASPAVGDIKMNVVSVERNGWLLCDGRSLNRTTYASLFAVIGTTFGAPDGSSFRLPNAAGRVLGATDNSAFPVGTATGLSQTALTVANVPSHTHSGSTSSNGSHTHSVSDPGHTHTQWTINDDFNNSGGANPSFSADSAGYRTWSNIDSATTGVTVNADGAHSHTFTTDGGAGLAGTSFGIMQPTLFVGYTFIFGG